MRSVKSVEELIAAGSLLRGETLVARHKGATYAASVEPGGQIAVKGRGTFRSLSAAASSIAETNLNGWRFWRVDRRHDNRLLADIRSELAN